MQDGEVQSNRGSLSGGKPADFGLGGWRSGARGGRTKNKDDDDKEGDSRERESERAAAEGAGWSAPAGLR